MHGMIRAGKTPIQRTRFCNGKLYTKYLETSRSMLSVFSLNIQLLSFARSQLQRRRGLLSQRVISRLPGCTVPAHTTQFRRGIEEETKIKTEDEDRSTACLGRRRSGNRICPCSFKDLRPGAQSSLEYFVSPERLQPSLSVGPADQT